MACFHCKQVYKAHAADAIFRRGRYDNMLYYFIHYTACLYACNNRTRTSGRTFNQEHIFPKGISSDEFDFRYIGSEIEEINDT